MNSISQQLTDALGIMILGMGLVFVFLSILILGVKLVASKFAPTESASAAPEFTPVASPEGMSPQMIAVISSAIHQYRKKA